MGEGKIMKKLAIIPVLLMLSIAYADNVKISFNYEKIVEPNDTVEIDLKIQNTADTYLWKCKALVDVSLLGDEIQYFTIVSEPEWSDKINPGVSVNGKLKIKISSDATDVNLKIPIIISGEIGACEEGCKPFMDGPFYIEISIKNRGIEAFNYAESLYNEKKYEEAMRKYEEAKNYFLKYSDDKNAKKCIIKSKYCEGNLKLSSGISYFNDGDLENAKKEFEDAKSIFETVNDDDMIELCNEWIDKCTEKETVTPTEPPVTVTSSPTITSPSATTPSPSPSSTFPGHGKTVFAIPIIAAIILILIATIKIKK